MGSLQKKAQELVSQRACPALPPGAMSEGWGPFPDLQNSPRSAATDSVRVDAQSVRRQSADQASVMSC